jgi:hypothetical protein
MEFEKISPEYDRVKALYESSKEAYFRFGGLLDAINGSNIVPEIDEAASQFMRTQSSIENLENA